jgi:hypothetical protein
MEVSQFMGVPQNRWFIKFIMENSMKVDDLGVSPFEES